MYLDYCTCASKIDYTSVLDRRLSVNNGGLLFSIRLFSIGSFQCRIPGGCLCLQEKAIVKKSFALLAAYLGIGV